MDHAGRFVQLCGLFDLLEDSYQRVVPPKQSEDNYPPSEPNTPYIITHLTHWVESYEATEGNLRTGGTHTLMLYNSNENRRCLPSTIRNAIAEISPGSCFGKKNSRVPVTWIVMYLHAIFPDETLLNWRLFECSHRCIEYNERRTRNRRYVCIDPECLVWESKSVNQSRGNWTCTRECTHNCGKILCVCQKLHDPPCI